MPSLILLCYLADLLDASECFQIFMAIGSSDTVTDVIFPAYYVTAAAEPRL